MRDIWFTSDLHLGHTNILKFEPNARPFTTIDEHDEVIIDNYNSCVKPTDKCYLLGDLVFKKENIIKLSRLNGVKYLVLGNHDYSQIERLRLYLPYFKEIGGCLSVEKFLLTHIPCHPCQFERYRANIHGHLHSKHIWENIIWEDKGAWIFSKRYFNVCVEQNNLKPFNYEEIKKRYADY